MKNLIEQLRAIATRSKDPDTRTMLGAIVEDLEGEQADKEAAEEARLSVPYIIIVHVISGRCFALGRDYKLLFMPGSGVHVEPNAARDALQNGDQPFKDVRTYQGQYLPGDWEVPEWVWENRMDTFRVYKLA